VFENRPQCRHCDADTNVLNAFDTSIVLLTTCLECSSLCSCRLLTLGIFFNRLSPCISQTLNNVVIITEPSIESLIAENERLRGELEHARAMVAVESQQRALLERSTHGSQGIASLVDELIANARSRELNERQSLLTDLELKQHTIIALQTEVDFLVSRVMAAGDKLSQLSDIAHTNEQNLLELDAMRSRLLEEEHAFAQLEASKATLVNELETLTQSLFEEANLLVSTEARERASAEADKLRLERELAAKELALRISKDLLANLGRKIHVASTAAVTAAAHTHDDQVPRSAPLPHFATGVAVRRRSIGALGAASLAASMVDASSAALASVHISSDYFPAAPSFAELVCCRQARWWRVGGQRVRRQRYRRTRRRGVRL
jgi:hypothetical protein